MVKKHWGRTVLGILVGGILLSACVLPEKYDPFERLPEEQVETIYGELFPFSVSVSTRATHRLEREDKLVGYLTSDLVRLEDFEGQEVELDGVWRTDKMREIFWVESVVVKGDEQDETPEELRFATKNFTFMYPSEWDYTESPDNRLFFTDKQDPDRRVFLTFAVEEFSPEAERIDPNIVLGSLAGSKVVTPQGNGKEREIITLYSNLGTQQYVFKADYAFDDFDKKRSLLSLLESFVEGESAVATVIEGEKIKKAELEATKLAEMSEREKLEAKAKLVDEVVSDDEQSFLERLLSKDKAPEAETDEPVEDDSSTEAPEKDEVEVVQDAIKEAVTLESARDYKNLIDGRAYSYNSQAFGFSVKAPFGHWYQNFGASGGNLFEMGFANNAITDRSSVDVWLRAKTATPPAQTSLTLNGDQLTITKARNETSVFEITGPVEFKDLMWSVLESIETL